MLDVTTDINVRQTAIENKFSSFQTTNTFSPQTSVLQNLAYNPQLILNSPYASLEGAMKQDPAITPSVIVTPGIDQGSGGYEEAKMGGIASSGMMDLLLIGALIIGGIFALGLILKKKAKVKKGVTGAEVDIK